MKWKIYIINYFHKQKRTLIILIRKNWQLVMEKTKWERWEKLVSVILILVNSSEWVSESRSVVSDSLQPHRLYSPWILQARILEWAAVPFSGVSSLPRDRTQASFIAGGFFTNWAIRKAPPEWECITKMNLHLLTCYATKPIDWHQFVGEGSTEFISCSKDPNSLMVSEKLFF